MSQERWNTIFERALLVDEPLRSDLLKELFQHANVSGKNLGDPRKLAFAYNRTHLGFFCSIPRLLLLPPFLWLALIAASGPISLAAEAWIGPTVIMIGIDLAIILMGIRSLAHIRKPLRAILAMMPVFVLSCVVFVLAVVVPYGRVNNTRATYWEVFKFDGIPVFLNWLPISFFSVFIPLTGVTLWWRLHLVRRKNHTQNVSRTPRVA